MALIAAAAACSFSSSSASRKPSSPPAATEAVASEATTPEVTVSEDVSFADVVPPPDAGNGPTLEFARHSQFDWPALGEITTFFGPGHPLGIDIGLPLDTDSPIRASAPGTVTFAGGNPCCEYGFYVVITEDDGSSTLYAHFESIGVTEGQHVEQGDAIGLGGSTGNSTGKHLHFEVHRNDQVVDPFRFLSAFQSIPEGLNAQRSSCSSQPLPVDPDSLVSLKFIADDLAGFQISSADIARTAGPSLPGLSEVTDSPGSDGPAVRAMSADEI